MNLQQPAVEDPPEAAPTGQAQRGRIASGFRTVSLLTFFSRVLGMVRDMVMAYAFGAGPLMDAFTVAFRIPNLARRLFGEGALTTAFLPVFMRELETRGPDAARRVATAVTLSLGATLSLIVIAGELLLGLFWLLVPAESDSRTLILLTAVMLPYLLLICVAAQVSAVLQSVERFFWPALLPTLLNVIWIAAVFIGRGALVSAEAQIELVAVAVVIAGLVQCGIALWAARLVGFGFARRWREAVPQVRQIAVTILPIVFGLSITQINAISDSVLAWGLARPSAAAASAGPMIAGIDWPLEAGTASALFYAQRMYLFPVGVFGIALGTVLFPLLSRHAERQELAQVGHDLTLGLRLTIAIGLPASVGLMLLSEPIAVLVFQRGAFLADDAVLTGQCILAYGSGVWAFLGLIIINRGFYALEDRLTPLRIGLFSVGLNLVLNLSLIWPLAGVGLAWATSIAAIVQVLASVAAYQRRFGLLDFGEVGKTLSRAVMATGAMAAVCWAVMHSLPIGASTASRTLAVVGPLTGAVLAYLALSRIIGLREPFELFSRNTEE